MLDPTPRGRAVAAPPWATGAVMVDVGGCEMHVVERDGPGQPVVLVHGLGASTVLWDAVVDCLPVELRVLAVDLRGAGASRERVDGEPVDFSTELWVSDLRNALTGIDVDAPVLVGHSLGATIALEYALRWGHTVAGLVLIGAEARLSSLAPRMQRSADMIRAHGMEGWVRDHWVANPPFGADSLQQAPELLDTYRSMLLANRAEDYVRACEAIVRADDLMPRLAAVAAPAMVVVGDLDDRTLPEAGRQLAAAIPGAEVLEVPNAGHTLPMEAPEEVANAIQALVARLDGRSDGST
jgi:pimeloyl-ACP methyl ester carboxylesterase